MIVDSAALHASRCALIETLSQLHRVNAHTYENVTVRLYRYTTDEKTAITTLIQTAYGPRLPSLPPLILEVPPLLQLLRRLLLQLLPFTLLLYLSSRQLNGSVSSDRMRSLKPNAVGHYNVTRATRMRTTLTSYGSWRRQLRSIDHLQPCISCAQTRKHLLYHDHAPWHNS